MVPVDEACDEMLTEVSHNFSFGGTTDRQGALQSNRATCSSQISGVILNGTYFKEITMSVCLPVCLPVCLSTIFCFNDCSLNQIYIFQHE